jgi:hypothetical protein
MATEQDRLDFLGLKIPRDQLADLKRRAREDERTLSAYVRRLLRQATSDRDREPQEER